MATEVKLPQLSMGMSSAVILRWLKREGDAVTTGEPLLEIEAEKTTAEIEAPASGVLTKLLVAEGEEVQTYSVIALIGGSGEAADTAVPVAASVPVAPTIPSSATEHATVDVTPLARRLAREAGIDLASVTGTGTGGRVTDGDVSAIIAARGKA